MEAYKIADILESGISIYSPLMRRTIARKWFNWHQLGRFWLTTHLGKIILLELINDYTVNIHWGKHITICVCPWEAE